VSAVTKPAAPAIVKPAQRVREEYLADNVRLICGDAIEIIPTLEIEGSLAVVTDPPFGIEKLVVGYGRTYAGGRKGEYDRNIAGDSSLDVMVAAFDQIIRKWNNIWLASFYSPRVSPAFYRATANMEFFAELVWDKKLLGMGYAVRYQHESIALFKIGSPEELAPIPSFLTFLMTRGGDKSGTHPHEKPEGVMYNLVEAIPGKTILDPFAGTSSTGVAAVRKRRGFIGIEKSETYFDVSRRKVSAALAQPFNFWEE
jgi:site-specific DNA-methyltransferase (adenine-specific)